MTDLYQSPEYRQMYAACLTDIRDTTGWGAMRDWLRERGVCEEVVAETEPSRRFGPYDVVSFLSGRGIGSGSGSGSGRGIGSGSGSGRGNYHEVFQMEPGNAYLVHLGDWHTFVGRCVKQVGPMTYLFESVSKVHETHGGDNWEALASGNVQARAAAEYRHYTTPATIPLSIIAFLWEGMTPQEAMEGATVPNKRKVATAS